MNALQRGLRNYTAHLREFSRDARLFLLSAFIVGISLSMFDVVFNFYLVSLGMRADAVGQIAGLFQIAIFLGALPAGVLSERIGRQRALLLSTLTMATALVGFVAVASVATVVVFAVMFGAGLALAYVTLVPFMMENSSPSERIHLFSFSQASSIGAGAVGGYVGGSIPGWAATVIGFEPGGTQAYQATLAAAALLAIASAAPLLALQPGAPPARQAARRALSGLRADAPVIVKVLLPALFVSFGAGLLIPFSNLFVRTRFGLADAQVGTLFSLMALAGGAASVTGPVLAQRFGKMRAAMLAHAAGVVMMALIGFSPLPALGLLAFMLRPALTQMAGPLLDAFAMESVGDESRATVASLNQMVWTIGLVGGPLISGRMQLDYGWEPIIAAMIAFYLIGIALRYWFFIRPRKA